MFKRLFRLFFAAPAVGLALLALLAALPVAAQDTSLTLSLSRDWGYSAGSDIQGMFTLSASGAQNLTSVTFMVDGQPMGKVEQAPFRLSFNTGNYAIGRHIFSASGVSTAGTNLGSNKISVNVLSGGKATVSAGRLIVPLVAIVVLAVFLGAGGSAWLTSRGRVSTTAGIPIKYGISGGAICRKCGRPFALNPFNMNLLTGKLARCPHCGKWSVVRRASSEALHAAAAAELAGAQPTIAELSPEEKLRRQIEESRYQ